MTAKTLMLQGTGSSVGKSLLVTALCRIFHQDGLRVAPYKSQNMALNSFVTANGGEMGRAQVVQAEAAGIEPVVDMNPILIKPEADAKSQIVVMGKSKMTVSAWNYYEHTPELLAIAKKSLDRLMEEYELIIIEGAGSPAEINLKKQEIVNMRIARLARAPVLLVGDIDKGGVFASLVGTLQLLDDEEKDYIRGFIINKFRGDIKILEPGLKQLEEMTSRKVAGVIPYIHDLIIHEEDAVHRIEPGKADAGQKIDIAVLHLPHISNSTDFEPLQQETDIRLRYVSRLADLGLPDVLIIPGSKTTISDLESLRHGGFDKAVIELANSGTLVIGICGGFQMLGKIIFDPAHIESSRDRVEGHGILDITTSFDAVKTTSQVTAVIIAGRGFLSRIKGQPVRGYEIHMGRTTYGDENIFRLERTAFGETDVLDGAVNKRGNVVGTYLHGLFENDNVRQALINEIKSKRNLANIFSRPIPTREEQYNRLADIVRRNLDMEFIYCLIGLAKKRRRRIISSPLDGRGSG